MPSIEKTTRGKASPTVSRAVLLPALQATPCRGLNREQSARYIGISPTKFDELVLDKRMPDPRRIDSRKVWDVRELDLFFDALPREDRMAVDGWEDFRIDGDQTPPR